MTEDKGQPNDTETTRREEVCRTLGLGSVLNAHRIIAAGAKAPPEKLLRTGLNARRLVSLGYDGAGMKRLGYSDAALEALGYRPAQAPSGPQAGQTSRTGPTSPTRPTPSATHPQQPPSTAPPSLEQPVSDTSIQEILRAHGGAAAARVLIASGCHAAKMKELGVSIQDCKKAEVSPSELSRIGYELCELARAFSCFELRRAGFSAGELNAFFGGQELRSAGCTATDLRVAGFSIRDLRKFGFSDNYIVAAGYSINELQREGLTKRVTERKSMRR